MVKCCVPLCYNASYRKTPEIAFHRFPKDEYLRNAWIKNINRKDWQPNSSNVICSEHFQTELLSGGAFRTVLATGAIPTIFKKIASSVKNKKNEPVSPEPSSISRKRTATGNVILHKIVEQSTSTTPETPAAHLSATAISLKPEMSTVQPGPSWGTPHVKTIGDLHVNIPLPVAVIQVLQPNTSTMFATPADHLSTAIEPSRSQMQMPQSNVTSHARKPGCCCSSARDLRKLKQTLISKNKSLKALRAKIRRLKEKITKLS